MWWWRPAGCDGDSVVLMLVKTLNSVLLELAKLSNQWICIFLCNHLFTFVWHNYCELYLWLLPLCVRAGGGQVVWVECTRHRQHVLGVALAAAGGAKWPGPPQRPAHLPHHSGHRGGQRCRPTAGHGRQPRRHREHPQDGQGGENGG